MSKSTKVRRNSGRVQPRYHEKLPYKLRNKYDLFDENIIWDDWIDYRDGWRNNKFWKKSTIRDKLNQ